VGDPGRPAFDDAAALRAVVEGTATETGARFFGALVEALARALGTDGAWVTEYDPVSHRLRAFAFWCNGERLDGYQYALPGTPCGVVIDRGGLLHIPDRAMELYPDDPDLERFAAFSYLGVPLRDVDGTILGHLAVMDSNPLPADPRVLALFNVFAARAAAEHQRLRAEADVRARDGALPRRDRRAAARHAGEAPPRPPGRRVRARRQLGHAEGRRAHHRGDQPRPGARGARGPLPRAA
jgi:GAF domain-containing protein